MKVKRLHTFGTKCLFNMIYGYDIGTSGFSLKTGAVQERSELQLP